jgi:hypothetical protein
MASRSQGGGDQTRTTRSSWHSIGDVSTVDTRRDTKGRKGFGYLCGLRRTSTRWCQSSWPVRGRFCPTDPTETRALRTCFLKIEAGKLE